jgi:hypothetical protein
MLKTSFSTTQMLQTRKKLDGNEERKRISGGEILKTPGPDAGCRATEGETGGGKKEEANHETEEQQEKEQKEKEKPEEQEEAQEEEKSKKSWGGGGGGEKKILHSHEKAEHH